METNDILGVINTYSADHPIKNLLDKSDLPFPGSYLSFLCKAIINVNKVSTKAAKDFINNKIRSKREESYDVHNLFSALCELSILNTMLIQSNNPKSFDYEPKPNPGSKKNPEFSIEIADVTYYIEVKAPNMENQENKLNAQLDKRGSVMQFDSRFPFIPEEIRKESLLSTDSRVKDFLVDANKKFKKRNWNSHYNILFICWNAETDQPATALKDPWHGLLTKNSWFKDEAGNIVKFENVDIIFINDLYQNHLVHMSCTTEPMPSTISSVPYFDRLTYEGMPNPFILPYSRNVMVENEIDEKIIFPLPISRADDFVDVVTEEYVTSYCADFKVHFRPK
ncbi:MAG: hypothetical protein N3B21_00385 [Clostridia bacterium]|nr:hypothetical protein [Clostridia bacterium]